MKDIALLLLLIKMDEYIDDYDYYSERVSNSLGVDYTKYSLNNNICILNNQYFDYIKFYDISKKIFYICPKNWWEISKDEPYQYIEYFNKKNMDYYKLDNLLNKIMSDFDDDIYTNDTEINKYFRLNKTKERYYGIIPSFDSPVVIDLITECLIKIESALNEYFDKNKIYNKFINSSNSVKINIIKEINNVKNNILIIANKLLINWLPIHIAYGEQLHNDIRYEYHEDIRRFRTLSVIYINLIKTSVCARIIQMNWRAFVLKKRKKAVSLIQDYIIEWLYKPNCGLMYKKLEKNFYII